MKGLLNFVLLAVSVVFLGCRADPVSQTSSNNPDIQVGLLFEHEGSKVYRFKDGGNYIYYVVPAGRTEWTTQTTHSNGKSSQTVTHRHAVETLEK